MTRRSPRLLLPLLIGALLLGIFGASVTFFRAKLRAEIRQTIINRDAAVLYPFALRQLAHQDEGSATPTDLLAAVLDTAQQENMLAVAIFDAQGRTLRFAPDSLLFAELPLDDYLRLLKLEPISRYHPAFPLDRYFAGVSGSAAQRATPVLEVLLPLHGRGPKNLLGFAQYYIDARALAGELTLTDQRLNRETAATSAIGAILIAAVVIVAYRRLEYAYRVVAEQNEKLIRTNFELTLAVKASALGQITSHLIHGLQGSVAGLRAVVAAHDPETTTTADWQTAAGYAERMQAVIQEAVGLLNDDSTQNRYELTGHDLAEIIRRRNAPFAVKKGVGFSLAGGFDASVDSHRGGLLALISSNLIENAIDATDPGRRVEVILRNGAASATVIVADEGHGIPEEILSHLFEPGRTGRAGGTGLGLAISQLLAKQIGATLVLDSTGPDGTTFRLTLPLDV